VAEKSLLEKLREDYVAAKPDAAEAVSDFCNFAEKWLAEHTPTGVSYTVDGLMLQLVNGDSFVLVASPNSDNSGIAVSVTGSASKFNARASSERSTDFPITGR
jgi:hypothetical protein